MTVSFQRVDTDADSRTPDTCCGEFVGRTSGEGVPEAELSEGVVYVYARCRNCNALWRDGFQDADVSEYEFGELDVDSTDIDWTVSHVDTNKVHDGRAYAVYVPDNNPVEEWIDSGVLAEEEVEEFNMREQWDADECEKRTAYVYRFSEIAGETAPPVTLESMCLYSPSGAGAADECKVTDMEFDDDGVVTDVTITAVDAGLHLREGDAMNLSWERFVETCTLVDLRFDSVRERPTVDEIGYTEWYRLESPDELDALGLDDDEYQYQDSNMPVVYEL